MRVLPGQALLPFDPPAPPAAGRTGPPCLRCGSDTLIGPGSGPHAARARCPDCGHHWWLPKNFNGIVERDKRACDNLSEPAQKRTLEDESSRASDDVDASAAGPDESLHRKDSHREQS